PVEVSIVPCLRRRPKYVTPRIRSWFQGFEPEEPEGGVREYRERERIIAHDACRDAAPACEHRNGAVVEVRRSVAHPFARDVEGIEEGAGLREHVVVTGVARRGLAE